VARRNIIRTSVAGLVLATLVCVPAGSSPSVAAVGDPAQVLGDHLDRPAVTASARSDGTATVAWQPVPGATSYAVQWRRSDRAGRRDAGRADGTSLDVRDLVSRVGYSFRVRAKRAGLVSDFSAESATRVPPVAAVASVAVASCARMPGAGGFTVADSNRYVGSLASR